MCRYDALTPSNVIETEDETFAFQGIDPSLFTAVIGRLDGRRSAHAIAKELGASQATVERLCQVLVRSDLATWVEPPSTQSAEDFADACCRMFPAWKRRVFGHPLWRSLADGTATRNQFAGWLVETYHFIETVNSRLALAVAECRNPLARALFLHHYVEEWDHHHFFMTSLQHAGFDPHTILASRPLPGTLAVVNFMRATARRDPLYYAACSGFLESTGDDRDAGREFFGRLIQHYCPGTPEIINPMIAHLNLDEQYRHNGLLTEIFPTLGTVTRERLTGALQAVVQLIEALELWADDILRSYVSDGALPNGGVRMYRAGERWLRI